MNDYLNTSISNSPSMVSSNWTKYLPGNSNSMWGAIASAGASLLNGILGSSNSSKNNQRQIEFARQSQQEQERFSKEMFNLENQWNSPDAVMSRLSNAGINPAVYWSNGGDISAADGNGSISPVQPNTQPVPSFLSGMVGNSPFESLQALLAAEKTKAEIAKTGADTRNIDAATAKLQAEEELTKFKAKIEEIKSKYTDDKEKAELDHLLNVINKDYQEFNLNVQKGELNKAELAIKKIEKVLKSDEHKRNGIELLYLPDTLRSIIAGNYAGAAASRASAGYSNALTKTENETRQYKVEQMQSDLKTAFGDRIANGLNNYIRANGLDNALLFGNIQALKLTGQLNKDNIISIISNQSGEDPEKVRKALGF